MEEKLRETLSSVTMPEDMRSRLNRNVAAQTAQHHFRLRPALLTAALVLCITLPLSVAALGGEGFFKDVKNIFGAVTGTEYENATEEIAVTANLEGNTLLLHVELLTPEKAPYPYIEQLSVGSYEVLDDAGTVLAKGNPTDALPMEDGRVTFIVPVVDGAVSVKITEFIANKKAEQPLPIFGEWICVIE